MGSLHQDLDTRYDEDKANDSEGAAAHENTGGEAQPLLVPY